MQKKWQRLHSKTIADLRLFEARIDTLRNPKNGETVDVTILTGGDSVNVLAITDENNAVLVDNYRFGTSSYLLELPGGMVDAGEDHQQAAKRELLEETGYTAKEWFYAGCVAANPVFQDSFVHHYLALGAAKTGETELDDAEDIEVRETPVEEVRKMLYSGAFMHPHSISGILRGLVVMDGEKEDEINI